MKFDYFVKHEQEGKYQTLPFKLPVNIESFSLRYSYKRNSEDTQTSEGNQFIARNEINIIDLGLIAPDGKQAGASGSDKTEITISETYATPGYRPHPMTPGEWLILLGVYKVAPEGVNVTYELTFQLKTSRWLKGDLHTHTIASDGVLTAFELAQHALRHGLDFLAITDHNQMVSASELPQLPGITLIPGFEWTHYLGHANFLGVDQPYVEPFHANTPEEIMARFQSARSREALIVLNHPFEEICPFKLDFNTLPFDCLEIWNGPMRESNLRALGLWQSLLTTGKKIPICGGSDYHHSQLFLFPGGPTTFVKALSSSPKDILSALRMGHAYITYAPDGPQLEFHADEAIMGESVSFSSLKEMSVQVHGLKSGDVVQIVTAEGNHPIFKAPSNGDFSGIWKMEKPGFARVEIWRGFLPGLPLLPALISNPIYFD
jgi:hypothetical protein